MCPVPIVYMTVYLVSDQPQPTDILREACTSPHGHITIVPVTASIPIINTMAHAESFEQLFVSTSSKILALGKGMDVTNMMKVRSMQDVFGCLSVSEGANRSAFRRR